MKFFEYQLHTDKEGFTNVTHQVQQALRESGMTSGLCVVYCPHTTAGITVNENADPDVVRDMLLGLSRAYPDSADFRHFEGNSSAHLRASAVGCSQTFIVEGGKLLRGQWQGIYFCEFDGPRNRSFYVKILGLLHEGIKI